MDAARVLAACWTCRGFGCGPGDDDKSVWPWFDTFDYQSARRESDSFGHGSDSFSIRCRRSTPNASTLSQSQICTPKHTRTRGLRGFSGRGIQSNKSCQLVPYVTARLCPACSPALMVLGYPHRFDFCSGGSTMSKAVFFFGGWKSHLVDIKAWTADALKQKPSVTFDGFPFPDIESADDDVAIKAFSNPKHNDLAAAIKMIEASTRDVIFIVGHSSGCAIANKVDASLKDHKKIILVALDGFAPSNAQLDRTNTQVWSAESGAGKSLNHDRMLARIDEYNKKAKNKQNVNMFQAASGCTTQVALHFSLVNLASSDALVKH